MTIYYVYAYLRTNGTPYYIGKGKDNRAFAPHRTKSGGVHTPKDRSKIVFLEQHLTEIGAIALERRMIRWYGRKNNTDNPGVLRNQTDGGEGTSGYKHSVETIEKRASKLRGRKRPNTINAFSKKPEFRKRVAEWSRTRERTQAERKKIGDANRGSNHGRYNHTVYCWENTSTGEKLLMTQRQIIEYLDTSHGNISEVIKGNRNTCAGWRIMR